MKPVSDETREEDEKLRKELETVDLEKLKQAIKPLIAQKRPPKPRQVRAKT